MDADPNRNQRLNLQGEATFSDISEGGDQYLGQISRCAPTETFITHQQAISGLLEWAEAITWTNNDMEKLATEYLSSITDTKHYSPSTVQGQVYSIANFLAYMCGEDPEILTARLLMGLEKEAGKHILKSSSDIRNSWLLDSKFERSRSSNVGNLISYLRESHFGTRVHVFAELILDTKARPRLIRELDLSDFNAQDSTLDVGIGDNFLVGKLNIVTTRSVELEETTISALHHYFDLERPNPTVDGPHPLLATHHGRACESTLRRSMRNLSKGGLPDDSPYHSSDSIEEQEDQQPPVLPSDIWRYAIRELRSSN